jgi:hypothetical protein
MLLFTRCAGTLDCDQYQALNFRRCRSAAPLKPDAHKKRRIRSAEFPPM